MFVFIYCLHFRIIVDIMSEKSAMPFQYLQHAFLIFNGLIFQFQNQAIQLFGRKIIFHNFSPYKIRFSLQHVNAVTMRCKAKKKRRKVNNGFCWYPQQQDVEHQMKREEKERLEKIKSSLGALCAPYNSMHTHPNICYFSDHSALFLSFGFPKKN